MSSLDAKLAALEHRQAAALPAEGERDQLAQPVWSGEDDALTAENNARELRLWGDLLPAKRRLQRMGLGVWYTDAAGRFAGRKTAWINVGGKVVNVEQFIETAERARRVAAAAQ